MSFLPAEIIKKKRNGGENTGEEIEFLVNKFSLGRLPEYQMSAWLMAVYFNGMSQQEMNHLTTQMLHSGTVMNFDHLNRPRVDKHSTGGVGDKTSLIVGPIAASLGIAVPMISGRGLGHTGGTLDKLESIPGFTTRLDLAQFQRNVARHNLCFMGQTKEICPADRKIYALRDVTATVESTPLICASIMSKKLAEGIDGLVLDVKYGSGAFMKSYESAFNLAKNLIGIAKSRDKKIIATLSNMNAPLGRFIGNALEVKEALILLKNESSGQSLLDDTRQLSISLAADMIYLAGLAQSEAQASEMAEQSLVSGRAYEKFEQVCQAQGGQLDQLANARTEVVIDSPYEGFVDSFNTENFGVAAIVLGAGRKQSTDQIDPTAGIEMHVKVGDLVEKGQPLLSLYSSRIGSRRFEEVKRILLQSINISLQKPDRPSLIRERVIEIT